MEGKRAKRPKYGGKKADASVDGKHPQGGLPSQGKLSSLKSDHCGIKDFHAPAGKAAFNKVSAHFFHHILSMDGGRKNIPMEEKEMSFGETMEYIDSLRSYGVVPGLENMRNLCGQLGNPQDGLKFVHIAGTNGKGSVLCFSDEVSKSEG